MSASLPENDFVPAGGTPSVTAARSGLGMYFDELWRYRHFVVHLARSDVRARFRRSYLGFLWAGLHPLILVSMFSYVLATFSDAPFQQYAVFVFSGFILWDIITGSCISGSNALIGSASYLQQHRIPIAAFAIRSVLQQLMVSSAGLVAFTLFTAVLYPQAITFQWLFLPVAITVLVVFCIPLAVICSILNTLFRDFGPMLALMIQAMWFVSPIFIARDVFDTGLLKAWTAVNPVAALCDIWRATLMEGRYPPVYDFALVGVYTVVLWLAAILLLWRYERRIAFYL